MHELSIANSILDAVRTEAAKRPGARLVKVGVRVGEFSAVDPDALSFCFDVLVQGSELAPLMLEIERRPRRHRCPQCRQEFVVVDYLMACPQCGEPQTVCIGGDELELAYLELADSCSRPVPVGERPESK